MSSETQRVAALRRQIEGTRSDMDATLDAVARRTSPRRLLDDVPRLLRRHVVVTMVAAAGLGFVLGRGVDREGG